MALLLKVEKTVGNCVTSGRGSNEKGKVNPASHF